MVLIFMIKNSFRLNGQNLGSFFLNSIVTKNIIVFLSCQIKRKQALLESNLSGINLMADENVWKRSSVHRAPFIFSEAFMPLKTHQ